jgi:hypothetical protein
MTELLSHSFYHILHNSASVHSRLVQSLSVTTQAFVAFLMRISLTRTEIVAKVIIIIVVFKVGRTEVYLLYIIIIYIFLFSVQTSPQLYSVSYNEGTGGGLLGFDALYTWIFTAVKKPKSRTVKATL